MKVRLLVYVLLGAVAAALLLRDRDPGRSAPGPSPRARAPRPVRAASAPAAPITRNVFEYAPRPTPEPVARPMPMATFEPPPMTAPPEQPVHLVGLVRRGGVTKAVLKVHGATIEAAAGETAGGYRVLAVDDDTVRLQASDGTVVTLAAGGP